ncbi:MAG: tRNA (adenosine(37)-N6)-threonylcarbamoyltransferase complex ATPase subunit type 1 TsaE [Anaerotignaceae bacterium]
MIIETFTSKETMDLGIKLGKEAKAGDIFCLSGDLGVGKTVFTKGFAVGLDILDPYITSPTFTIINEHMGRLPLYHFDVYRIDSLEEMDDTGYEEYFFGKGVCLVEWAELVKELIPPNASWITIEKDLSKGEDYRKITVIRGDA